MKDRIKSAMLRNIAPRNPTQTALVRFLRMPHTGLKTAFDKNKLAFDSHLKKVFKKYQSLEV